jgi:hypothetical protein
VFFAHAPDARASSALEGKPAGEVAWEQDLAAHADRVLARVGELSARLL